MKKIFSFIVWIVAFVIGVGGGAFLTINFDAPTTEELISSDDLFYSYDEHELKKVELSGENGELSVHFLELGNKYTGDCTYIKVGDIDVLIDCGSRTNSIPVVSEYINQYITGELDFVIVTHAHRDHYAGFATGANTQGIFDLYDVGTIIDFGKATEQADSATYKRYEAKRQAEIDAGAKYFSAYECFYELETEFGKATKEFILDEENDVKLEILYNYYYQYNYTNPNSEFEASTENDYSVCCMLSQGENKTFLFTGDLEKDGEAKLVEYYENDPLPKMSVYKAGHHGSGTSSSPDLLAMIQPEIVCVCCCAGSPEYTSNVKNQFPTQEFITNISKYTDKVYVTTMCVDWEKDEYTSMNGNIVIIALPESEDLGIKCSNNYTILKETEWFNKTIIDENGNKKPNRIWNYSINFG